MALRGFLGGLGAVAVTTLGYEVVKYIYGKFVDFEDGDRIVVVLGYCHDERVEGGEVDTFEELKKALDQIKQLFKVCGPCRPRVAWSQPTESHLPLN